MEIVLFSFFFFSFLYSILFLIILFFQIIKEFKAFSLTGSPKLPTKFQANKVRNSIDSLRNFVVSYDSGKTILNESIKHQLQQQQQHQTNIHQEQP